MQVRRISGGIGKFLLVFFGLGVAAVGLLMGYMDIRGDFDELGVYVQFFFINIASGYMSPKLVWLWSLVFAYTYYAVHSYGVQHGYRPPDGVPYCPDEQCARECFYSIIPCLIGGVIGAVTRIRQNRSV